MSETTKLIELLMQQMQKQEEQHKQQMELQQEQMERQEQQHKGELEALLQLSRTPRKEGEEYASAAISPFFCLPPNIGTVA